MTEHDPGCTLDPVHWLRHAIAATNMRLTGEDEDAAIADRLSSAALLNALEHFAGQENWRPATLLDVAQFASLMGDRFAGLCTCRLSRRTNRHSRIW